MQIKKINSVNFLGATEIKTKNPAVLHALDKKDLSWRKLENPELRFVRTSGHQVEKDGVIHGILCNKEEKDAIQSLYNLEVKSMKNGTFDSIYRPITEIYKAISENAPKVMIESIEELKNLPMLKGIKFI